MEEEGGGFRWRPTWRHHNTQQLVLGWKSEELRSLHRYNIPRLGRVREVGEGWEGLTEVGEGWGLSSSVQQQVGSSAQRWRC